MKALTWHGKRDLRVEEVRDPTTSRFRSGWDRRTSNDGIDDLLPLVLDDADPLGTIGLASPHLPLEGGPHAYEIFQKKQDNAIKIVLHPGMPGVSS